MSRAPTAAPERIELPGGWYFQQQDELSWRLCRADGLAFDLMSATHAEAFAAAMQPAPSSAESGDDKLGSALEQCEALRGELRARAAVIDRDAAQIIALQERCNRMESAIRWANGEGDSDFGDNKLEGAGAFYWRHELMQRAGVAHRQPAKEEALEGGAGTDSVEADEA